MEREYFSEPPRCHNYGNCSGWGSSDRGASRRSCITTANKIDRVSRCKRPSQQSRSWAISRPPAMGKANAAFVSSRSLFYKVSFCRKLCTMGWRLYPCSPCRPRPCASLFQPDSPPPSASSSHVRFFVAGLNAALFPQVPMFAAEYAFLPFPFVPVLFALLPALGGTYGVCSLCLPAADAGSSYYFLLDLQ